MKVLPVYQQILLLSTATLIASAFAFAGCSSPDPTGSGSSECTPDLASIRQNILLVSCTQASCHAADQPAAGLDLTREDIETALVGGPAALCNGLLVVPGDPVGSVLYQKITTPSCGVRMPVTGALADAQIDCIEKWIAGLPSNGTGGGGGAGGSGGGNGGGPSCETCGGASCVDVQTDAAHCGSCSTACGGNMVCNMGMCAGGCGSLTQCGASCVDLQTSPENCGACGKGCAVGQTCLDGKCACGMSSVSFSAAVQPILSSKCATAGCHGGVMPQEKLSLAAGKSYAAMVNIAASQCNDGRFRVKPGDPSASYIVDKMTNVDICFGTKMPKLGQLPSGDIQTVVDWICQGALNN